MLFSDQFRICQEAFTGKCIVKSYKQCPKCLDMMKAVCSKKKCRGEDGSKPAMILPNMASSSRSLPVKRGMKTRDEDDLCSDISGFSDIEYDSDSDSDSMPASKKYGSIDDTPLEQDMMVIVEYEGGLFPGS